jgi:hypothetical protein
VTCKTVEIRDRGTFVPALAIRLDPADERDRYLLAQSGFGTTAEEMGKYVLLINLVKDAPYDAFGHGPARTLRIAHHVLIDSFDHIENGEVVDVEYLLGETAEKKRSEAETVSPR